MSPCGTIARRAAKPPTLCRDAISWMRITRQRSSTANITDRSVCVQSVRGERIFITTLSCHRRARVLTDQFQAHRRAGSLPRHQDQQAAGGVYQIPHQWLVADRAPGPTRLMPRDNQSSRKSPSKIHVQRIPAVTVRVDDPAPIHEPVGFPRFPKNSPTERLGALCKLIHLRSVFRADGE